MGLIYSRPNNLNLEILENRLCLWDGAEKAASFASGVASISTMLLALLQLGNVVYSLRRYTAAPDFFLKNVPRRFGIEAVSFRPTDTPAQLAARAAAIAPVRLASKPNNEENQGYTHLHGHHARPQHRLDIDA